MIVASIAPVQRRLIPLLNKQAASKLATGSSVAITETMRNKEQKESVADQFFWEKDLQQAKDDLKQVRLTRDLSKRMRKYYKCIRRSKRKNNKTAELDEKVGKSLSSMSKKELKFVCRADAFGEIFTDKLLSKSDFKELESLYRRKKWGFRFKIFSHITAASVGAVAWEEH